MLTRYINVLVVSLSILFSSYAFSDEEISYEYLYERIILDLKMTEEEWERHIENWTRNDMQIYEMKGSRYHHLGYREWLAADSHARKLYKGSMPKFEILSEKKDVSVHNIRYGVNLYELPEGARMDKIMGHSGLWASYANNMRREYKVAFLSSWNIKKLRNARGNIFRIFKSVISSPNGFSARCMVKESDKEKPQLGDGGCHEKDKSLYFLKLHSTTSGAFLISTADNSKCLMIESGKTYYNPYFRRCPNLKNKRAAIDSRFLWAFPANILR